MRIPRFATGTVILLGYVPPTPTTHYNNNIMRLLEESSFPGTTAFKISHFLGARETYLVVISEGCCI